MASASQADIPGLAAVRHSAQCDATITFSCRSVASSSSFWSHAICFGPKPPPHGLTLFSSAPVSLDLAFRTYASPYACASDPGCSYLGLTSVVSSTSSLHPRGSLTPK